MKKANYLLIALLAIMLSACGRPAYEGEYVSNNSKSLLPIKIRVVLGDESFIESSFGGKQFCDSLEERKADNKTYVTCSVGGQQLPIEIIDKDTISAPGMGKMYRVK